MFIPKRFRYMDPAGEGGGGGGGEVIDRGDDHTPTEDADDAAAAAAAAAKKDEPDDKKSALKDLKLDAEGNPIEELPEETEEEKTARVAAEAAEAAKKDGKKDTRIPAARHKEILDKERERREAVERELAQYKQGGKIADVNAEITEAETKLVALEQDYAKQLTDGEAAKAASTMTAIRKLERSINDKTRSMDIEAATARAVETTRYDATVDKLEEQFPELNVKHDDFDKAKTAEVLELKEAFQLKGYTPSEALQKAVKLIMPPVTTRQQAAVETESRVDAKAVEAARKAAAATKTADAAGKTPPSAAKVGDAHDSKGGSEPTGKDIMKMSHEQFVKLDEATLAKARGDVL